MNKYILKDLLDGGNTYYVCESLSFDEKKGEFKYSNKLSKDLWQAKAGDIWYYSWRFNPRKVVDSYGDEVYHNSWTVKYRIAETKLEKEEKLKGENLLGIQFCANSNELMAQGVNTYINKEYYCVKIDK